MKSASGVPEDQYLPAAKLGVCKVNIDTDGRLVWCAIHRESFRDDPANFDLRPPGKPFMAAYADYIVHKNHDARLGRTVGRSAEDAEMIPLPEGREKREERRGKINADILSPRGARERMGVTHSHHR